MDTNVPIVANGRPDPGDRRPPSIACRLAAVEFLQGALENGCILLDLAGEIGAEYRTYLSPRGQPGIGDRFYQAVLRSAPGRIERIDLLRDADGEFTHCPRSLIAAGFDRSDRKFAALAKRTNATVANATDSDWLHHRLTLKAEGIKVHFVCGCDPAEWFAA